MRAAPIAIRAVSRQFAGVTALRPVSLDVAAGEFVALVGPSGCGKTTLLRIVADLEVASTGDVRIGPDTASSARRARILGLVSQRPAVLPWKTALDDVRFTQRIARRAGFDAAPLLAEFGLAGHGGKHARELSGGMLQRVNIASAIAHDPAVLLMDEPFSALDELKREELAGWFGRELAHRPKTVLFVTHHIDEAVMLADRLVVFSSAPGGVLDVVSVDAPRPREPEFRHDPRFAAVASHVRALLFNPAGHA